MHRNVGRIARHILNIALERQIKAPVHHLVVKVIVLHALDVERVVPDGLAEGARVDLSVLRQTIVRQIVGFVENVVQHVSHLGVVTLQQ